MEPINNKQDIAITELQTNMIWVKNELVDIKNNHLVTLTKEIRAMKEALYKRPSILTASIVTILASTIVGLVVFLLTN